MLGVDLGFDFDQLVLFFKNFEKFMQVHHVIVIRQYYLPDF